jgi:hypothetical protein
VGLAIYATADARKPFEEWTESLKDYEAKARVFVRLGRVRAILAIAGRWAMAFPNFASKPAQATACTLGRTAER